MAQPGYTADAPVRVLFPSVRVRPLWTGAGSATATALEVDPGAAWPHRDVHAPAGSWHVPQTATGCTLFVFHPEG